MCENCLFSGERLSSVPLCRFLCTNLFVYVYIALSQYIYLDCHIVCNCVPVLTFSRWDLAGAGVRLVGGVGGGPGVRSLRFSICCAKNPWGIWHPVGSPYDTFSAIWDRLRLAVGYVFIKVDEVLPLATYSSKLSVKPDLGYHLVSLSVTVFSFSTKPAIRDGLRLQFRLCLFYSQYCPLPPNQSIEVTSVTIRLCVSYIRCSSYSPPISTLPT